MASAYATGVQELILHAKENPAVPIVDKLLNRGDRLLIHGYEETYKSGFAMELARCIATGKPFLGELKVPKPLRVGIIETEMRNPGLGERLARMFPNPEEAVNIRYLNEAGLKALREAKNLEGRVKIIEDFLVGEGCEVAIFDSSADVFSSSMSPDDEQDVQKFFDELEKIKSVSTQIHIRHDSKPKQGGADGNKNNLTRGSSRWKEVPETMLHFSKQGNSHQAVQIDVGKLRYGRKPVAFSMRFDQTAYTIVPANPVLWLLSDKPLTHEELANEYLQRYRLKERTLSDHLKDANPYVVVKFEGGKRTYSRRDGVHPDFIWRYKDAEE
jgi:RecA-family ATPase